VGPRAGLDDVKRKLLTLPGLEIRSIGRPVAKKSKINYKNDEVNDLFATTHFRIVYLLGCDAVQSSPEGDSKFLRKVWYLSNYVASHTSRQ
jgi:hypothetical protein